MALTADARTRLVEAARSDPSFEGRLLLATEAMKVGRTYSVETFKSGRRSHVSGRLVERNLDALFIDAGKAKATRVPMKEITRITTSREAA